MPFPFFRLPFEIRHMIYQHVFTPADKHKHKCITPDIRPFHLKYHEYRTTFAKGQSAIALHCQALSLIRTCQQAHDEGTNVLYGQNTFRFSDKPYFEDSPCFDDDTWDYDESGTYCEPTYLIPSGVFLPFCEVTYMYSFLSVIGKANQSKIRHVELVFDTEMFLTFPGQCSIWTNVDQYEIGGAGCISDALDFLSENHRLQSLYLSFEGLYEGMAGFSMCFSKDSRLARRFTQYKAIEKFECDIDGATPDIVDLRRWSNELAWYGIANHQQLTLKKDCEEAIENYQELKLKLELEAAHQKESGQHDSYPTKRRFQSDPISQHEASSV